MNFGSLHYFLLIKTNGKIFKTPCTVLGRKPARGLQLCWANSLLRRPRPGWRSIGQRPRRPGNRTRGRAGAHRRAVTAAAVGAVVRAAPAHHWVRCNSVCGMSTTRVEATHRPTRGSGRLTVTVSRHEDGGGGLARWRSEAVLRGMACGSDVPYVSRKNRG
jgi:hypothetical protein